MYSSACEVSDRLNLHNRFLTLILAVKETEIGLGETETKIETLEVLIMSVSVILISVI